MPDEWLNGYLERVRYLNCLSKNDNIIEVLKAAYKLDISKNTVEALSSILNQSVQTLVLQNTLIPAIRAVTDNGYLFDHGTIHLNALGLRKMHQHARYCPICIQEDIAHWAFPYLRRSHQVTGIDWCIKHQVNLETIDTQCIPDPAALSKIGRFTASKSSLNKQHPIIKRYVSILDGLLFNNKPISAEHASLIFSKIAVKKGLNISPTKKGTCLSDIALQEVSGTWLFEHFPILKNKQPEEFIPSFDGVTIFRFQNHSQHYFILGAAILFDDSDEALNVLINEHKVKRNAPKKAVKRPEGFWQSDDLRRIYIKNIGSCRGITNEIGGDYEQNRTSLNKNGLPPLSIISNETIEALDAFFNGASIDEVFDMKHVNKTQLQHILKNAGHTFKSIFNEIKPTLIKNNALKVKKITLNRSLPNSREIIYPFQNMPEEAII